jgi:hypothetical protein
MDKQGQLRGANPYGFPAGGLIVGAALTFCETIVHVLWDVVQVYAEASTRVIRASLTFYQVPDVVACPANV